MDKKRKSVAAGMIGIFLLMFILPGHGFAEEITIVGKVDTNFQIVTEVGTVYQVADTDMGNDLMENIGKMVEVTGVIGEAEGVKTIDVQLYKILDE